MLFPQAATMTRTFFHITTALVLLLVFFGCSAKKGGEESKGTASAANTEKAQEEQVPVKVAPVGTGAISLYIVSSTTADTEQQVEVFSKATGICASMMVEEGDRVRKDQVLATLDDSEPRLAEIQARVSRDKLAASLKRAEKMLEGKLLSDEAYEDVRFQYEAAEAEWKMAKIRLEDTVITAPISGTIAQRNVKVGMNVTPAIALFRIVDFESLIATVFVPELDMANLGIGQRTIVTADALPDREFEGTIKRISPVVDPASGTIKVTVDLSESSEDLVPGLFIRTKIVLDTRKDALILPRRALVKEDERAYVFVVKDGAARKVEIGTGYADGERVEILNGLASGDLVVVDGQSRLRDGMLVRVIEQLPANSG